MFFDISLHDFIVFVQYLNLVFLLSCIFQHRIIIFMSYVFHDVLLFLRELLLNFPLILLRFYVICGLTNFNIFSFRILVRMQLLIKICTEESKREKKELYILANQKHFRNVTNSYDLETATYTTDDVTKCAESRSIRI